MALFSHIGRGAVNRGSHLYNSHLDPASHEEANRIVRASKFFNAEDDGLMMNWGNGRVFINPPGGQDPTRKQSLVALFWCKLLLEARHIEAAIWIGYSLEQLQTLQCIHASHTPLDFPMCVPSKRIAFIENEAKRAARIAKLTAAGKPVKDSGPSHSNYITYIGKHPERFQKEFARFGQVVIR